MNFLDKNQITETFNNLKSETIETNKSAIEALQHLSRAISDLQNAGVDVGIEVFPFPNAQSFNLIPKDLVATLSFSGLIRISNIYRLFALTTVESNQPVSKLYLSSYDIRYPKYENTIRNTVYDMTNDDAIINLQRNVINRAVHAEIVTDNDVAGVFDNQASKGPVIKKDPLNFPPAP